MQEGNGSHCAICPRHTSHQVIFRGLLEMVVCPFESVPRPVGYLRPQFLGGRKLHMPENKLSLKTRRKRCRLCDTKRALDNPIILRALGRSQPLLDDAKIRTNFAGLFRARVARYMMVVRDDFRRYNSHERTLFCAKSDAVATYETFLVDTYVHRRFAEDREIGQRWQAARRRVYRTVQVFKYSTQRLL